MKSFVVQSNVVPEEKEIKFPVLAKFREDSNFIMMFKSEKCGIVLQSGISSWSVGYEYSDLIPVSYEGAWQILPNNYQFILQNDQ